MKYYFLCGEASGDQHAAKVIRHIYHMDTQAMIRGWGGPEMEKSGATIVKNIRDLAFMGFVEVAQNLRTILNNFKEAKKDITTFDPDVIVLVDYPGFNLRMAKWAKQNGYKVVYYIAPQVWAWKEKRVEQLRKYTDRLICILPFEKEFFAKHHMEVEYVGHPLVEDIPEESSETKKREVIALLPGSRKQEISCILPELWKLRPYFPGFQFKILKAPGISDEFYLQFIEDRNALISSMQKIFSHCAIALTASGTATLQTALYNIPQIVCFKGNAISVSIAKRLIKTPFISLVNLIAGRKVVEELIQENCRTENIVKYVNNLLVLSPEQRKNMYSEIRHQLGDGTASVKAGNIIMHIAGCP